MRGKFSLRNAFDSELGLFLVNVNSLICTLDFEYKVLSGLRF